LTVEEYIRELQKLQQDKKLLFQDPYDKDNDIVIEGIRRKLLEWGTNDKDFYYVLDGRRANSGNIKR
jgi:hypothetical protein